MRKLIILALVALCILPVLAQSDHGQPLSSTESPSLGTLLLGMEWSTPPRPLETVRPHFPKGRWKDKLALVELEGEITTSGDVKDPHVVSGDQALASVALASVQQWKYAPAKANGAPVEIAHHFYFVFNKQDHSVHLGPDELSPDLPLEPSEDILADITAAKLSTVGKGVVPPKATYMPDPIYSELARKLKYQGTSTLAMVVTPEGNTRSIWVVVPAGEGLDEKALAAVSTWKFKPAMRGDEPVAVVIKVEVSFHLY